MTTTQTTNGTNGHHHSNGKSTVEAKTAFVLAQGDATAAQIVERAKAQGMDLTTGYVYTLRSDAKKRRGKQQPKKRRPAVSKASQPANRLLVATRELDETERKFLELALDLGFGRAASRLAWFREICSRVLER